MAWIFTVALLTMANIAAEAQVKVIFGDDGKESYYGTGGKITYSQTDPDNGKVTVTITASPNEGFTINKEDIHVYEVISPNMTRAGELPEIGKRLDLDGPKGSRSEKTDYSVTIDAKLGLWIKKATFNNSRGSKAGTSDYSGTYYIASGGLGENLNKTNGKEYTYDPTNPSNNFYLCPTEGWCYYQATNDFTGTDNGMPFLTTYQCRNGVYDAIKAVWYVEKDPNSSYYYIRQAKTGKYLVANGVIRTTNSGQDRMRVHLEEIANLNEAGNKVLFSIDLYGNYLVISPKEIVDGDNYTDHDNHKNHKWLTVNNGNYNSLKGESGKTGGPTGYANTAGIICIFTQNDANAPFYLEKATVDPPIITNNYTAENTFTIKATEGDTIYYTTDGTTPTTSTTTTATSGTGITPVNVTQTEDMTVIKAIAKGTGDYSYFPSAVATYNIPRCEKPVIKVSGGNVTITCATEGAIIHYTTNGDHATSSSDEYTVPFAKGDATTIRAIAVKNGYINSNETSLQPPTEVSSSTQITDMSGNYLLTSDFTSSAAIGSPSNPFKGTIDGNYHAFSLTGHALVAHADGATIKNIIISSVSISGSDNAGAIANTATGDTKIYNCGVLSGSVSGINAGGLVGHIASGSRVRVVNCYNYANVSGSDYAAGIVGYNEGAVGDVRIAMCMMYGTVSDATNISPVYAGNHVSNAQNFTEYNYYLYSIEKDANGQKVIRIPYTAYNDQLAIDNEEYLVRYPFYRHILNNHRELASYFLFGDYDSNHIEELGHWVKKKGVNVPKYPVIEKWEVNRKSTPTKENNDLPSTQQDYAGKLLTDMGDATYKGYLKVSITIDSDEYTEYLPITDMDTLRYDYNYGKVILPFANEYKINTDYSRICTGWKITSVSGGTAGSFANYNFADRDCTAKDIYNESTNPFIFAQGGYYIVPTGVTGISIEANFATAYYLSDASYEIGYTSAYDGRTGLGGDVPTEFHGKTVYNSLATAVSNLSTTTTNPHKQAIVLVGNYHYDLANTALATGKGFTLMSIDEDNNQEPDYGFYSIAPDRPQTPALRFDFVPIISLGMAAKVNGSVYYPGVPIWKPRGWYEQTETTVSTMNQFELDSGNFTNNENGNGQNPCIINGGYFVQMIRSNVKSCTKVSYFKIGGNAHIKEFFPGSHSNKASMSATLVPINVTGGQVDECYMTGYRSSAKAIGTDIRFWCSGGKIGKFLGAYMDEPWQTTSDKGTVNMTAQVDHALIGRFFGGGTSPSATITGDINVTINNSKVDFYCGGPEFGDMSEGKVVTTNANNTKFGEYYGAGFGGTAITYSPKDGTPPIGSNVTFTGYTYNTSRLTNSGSLGLATCYKFEYLMHSANKTMLVARFITGYANFNLATTGNVTNNLTGCTIEKDFYGAGCQGKVNGTVTSTLTSCELKGNAFGGGYKAENNTVKVYPAAAPTLSVYNGETGIFSEFGTTTPVTFTWEQGNGATPVADEGHLKLKTSKGVTMTELGNVTKAISLTIDGGSVDGAVFGGGNESKSLDNTTVVIQNGATVENSVYGGGNLAVVNGDTHVTINGGSMNQSVYGGGCEADVMGNTNVTMTDGYVFNGIFGGGLAGSVGTFTRSTEEADVNIFGHTTHEGCIGKPTLCADGTGKCKIVVIGGQIGPIEVATLGMKRPVSQGGPVPEGWVWGGGCGLIEDPATHLDTHFKTYVGSTDVTIGGNAFILESIIGGGEFGRVLGDTHVTIEGNCQIGVGEGQVDGGKPVRYADEKFINPATTTITNDNALPACSHFDYGHDSDGDGNPEYLTFDPYYDKYYDTTSGSHKDNIPDGLKLGSTSHPSDGKTWIGCVFGGGSGYFPYEKDDGTGYGWVRSAGWVEGNTLVEIKGGHILTNVYGANEYTDVKGKSVVIMSGGTVGVPRTLDQIKANPLNGNIFGAGKGDPRTNFNEITNVDSTKVEITGGIIYGSVYGGGEDGHVIDNAVTTIKKETGEGKKAPVIGCDGTAGNNGNVFGGGEGATIALTAGVVGGNITLNILDGHIKGSVYGGGELASVGTYFAMANDPNYGLMQEGDKHGCIAVNLKGGSIYQNVYGGCMGTNENDALGISKNVTVNLNEGVADNAQGCVVKGNIFGCNNVNSSPEGTVTVHVYGTQHEGKSQIANTSGDSPVTDAKTKGSYDVHAVYGGGNMAAYTPKDLTTGTTDVVIYGCGRTSIRQVYGGGNAASTPATKVTVNGTFEIEELFGGGNGKDSIIVNNVKKANPGANVGFKDYSAVESTYDTKEKRQQEAFVNTYVYGTGQASVNVFGGTIHRVFGGSNTKGNVRQTAVTMLEEAGGCEFCVDEAYGGGKSAPMDAEAKLLMSCIPGLQAAYGGAEAADILGNVTLNITNGTFDRVFGGNNLSGTISGSITVNIEEVGCKPVKIGELYGGGNQAAYSVYGYDNGTIKESGTRLYNDPVVNVKSFTSIGSVFGGGYGEGATLVGNPTVNINEVYGKYYNDDASVVGENAKTSGNYPIPSHAKGKMGAINNVFGGGNAARVIGNTTVNIGTRDKIDYVTTESGESTPRTNITVVGADIRGNVYGGGNNAEVTGNAEVVIGEKKTE